MSEQNNNIKATIIAPIITTLFFLLLQLFHVINWSWWAISAPLWGTATHWGISSCIYALIGKKNPKLLHTYYGISGIANISLIFAILKLLNALDWKWIIILIPLWISIGILILTKLYCVTKHRHEN